MINFLNLRKRKPDDAMTINDCSKGKIDLVWHIGFGKTGTSSIQNLLTSHFVVLEKQGVKYMGYMLENTVEKLYAWQVPSRVEEFHKLSIQETEDCLKSIFHKEINTALEKGIRTLVWSNESFVGRTDKVANFIKKNRDCFREIIVVAYIRPYDSWVVSAYIQWGIQHKIHKGNVLKFREWVLSHKSFFYEKLSPILSDKFYDYLIIENIEEVENLLLHFLDILNVKLDDFSLERINKSPDIEEIYFRAIFNNKFEKSMLPNEFDLCIKNNIHKYCTPEEYLADLLPDQSDIEWFRELTAEDRHNMDGYLRSVGKACIGKMDYSAKDWSINSDIIVNSLSEIIMEQVIKVNMLQERLIALEEKIIEAK